MYFGIIDLGTASLRAEVFRLINLPASSGKSLPLERVYHRRFMPRLGEGLYERHLLSEEAKAEAENACAELAKDLEAYPGIILKGAATSALREAADGSEFISHLRSEFSLPLVIIDGLREAELTGKGILAYDVIPKDPTLLIDIGGGSTEMSIVRKRELIQSFSFPIGSVRLKSSILSDLPPSADAEASLRDHVASCLAPLNEYRKEFRLAVGSSAAARTVCRHFGCEYGEQSEISSSQVFSFISTLLPLTLEETAKVHGIGARRADIVLSGSLILDECLRHLEIPSFRASRYSLRHGLLRQMCEEIQNQNKEDKDQ